MRCNTRSAISMQNVRLGVTATTDDRDDVLIDPGTKKLSLKSERLLKMSTLRSWTRNCKLLLALQ